MKVLKLCLLATILTLTLSLLLSCGDGADGLHGDSCTCDECPDGENDGTEGDNDPEKGDTPPADSDFTEDFIDEGWFSYKLVDLGSPPEFLEEIAQYGTYIYDKWDLKYVVDWINEKDSTHSHLGSVEVLKFLQGKDESFLEDHALYVGAFRPICMGADSPLKLIYSQYGGDNFIAPYYYRDECVCCSNFYSGPLHLIMVEMEKRENEPYPEIFMHTEHYMIPLRTVVDIPISDEANSTLCEEKIEFDKLGTMRHTDTVIYPMREQASLINSKDDMADFLANITKDPFVSADEEFAALGIDESFFENKVLIGFVTKASDLYQLDWLMGESINLDWVTVKECRVKDGTLVLKVSEKEGLIAIENMIEDESFYLILTYVAIDRSLLNQIDSIEATFLHMTTYFKRAQNNTKEGAES